MPSNWHQDPDGLKAEVWVINTQEAHWQSDLLEAFSGIQYWRLKDSDAWQLIGQESFFSALASPLPTLIYIHGNWTDLATAIEQAWTLCGPVWKRGDIRRFRLIIWCWPAQRTGARLLTDLRFKAGRSDVEAYLLALHLQQMPSEEPILLVGYSFGARVITGALHLVGGGRLMSRSLPAEHSMGSELYSAPRSELGRLSGQDNKGGLPGQFLTTDSKAACGLRPSGRFRAILVAAAIGNDWLLPGGRHQHALAKVEKMLVTVNRLDPALRWYARLEPCDSPALGWAGLPADYWNTCAALPTNPLAKIQCLWVTATVGKVHNWRLYFQTSELQARLPEYLFTSGGFKHLPSP
ncbi:MAG: hypothetical protein NZ602_04320 [Thermoguttaceae bacterium]|nr:hypothetical protein [Thermoguttaceae bacterium]MDW8036661.1 hypothetical protein [Thermoguttaceae bacterium]